MKIRLTALLLLFALALTACTSAGSPSVTDAPVESSESDKPTVTTEEAVTTEAPTEAPTEATEAATEADASGVDLGVLDGNDYENKTLGIRAAFPEGWYLYSESDLAAMNNLGTQEFDSAVINNAIENGQPVVLFCASHPDSISSVNITAAKNLLTGLDEKTLIERSAAQVIAQLEQAGMMQNIADGSAEVEFCGQKHPVLTISGDVYGMRLYEAIVFLPVGDLLYNVTVSSAQDTAAAEILGLFDAIG